MTFLHCNLDGSLSRRVTPYLEVNFDLVLDRSDLPDSLKLNSSNRCFSSWLRLVFTSDGVGVGVVRRSRKSAYDLVKIKNRSRKRSHKLDGIGVRRIRRFPFSSASVYDSVACVPLMI